MTVQIRVLAASTGVSYPISLHPDELTVANVRRHLAGTIPPQDQILLLGPPYKVPKDATLRSPETLAALRLGNREDDPNNLGGDGDGGGFRGGPGSVSSSVGGTDRSGAKRLFLFSKRALSDSAPDPAPCILSPLDLILPTRPDPSPVAFPRDPYNDAPASPLHQALEVYERRFMLHLCRGRALADGSDLRLLACRSTVAEMAVMARALRAAVSNLSDHRNGAARTRAEFASKFQLRVGEHASVLGSFERSLTELGAIALHPALVTAARSSGRVMATLLDAVPVERERAWHSQCRTSHARLTALFGELEGAFGTSLGTAADREEEARGDLEAEGNIAELAGAVEGRGDGEMGGAGIRDRQAERLGRLTADHGEAVRLVTAAVCGVSSSQGAGLSTDVDSSVPGVAASSVSTIPAQEIFSSLESMSTVSSSVLPSMESDDLVLRSLMVRCADAKTAAMRRMRSRLRQVSVAQSAIQRVISNVAVLRDALSRQCENVSHLEHVSALPEAYRGFLSEVRRRRAYGEAVSSTSGAMMARLATMRNDETRARERFLRGSGQHLMPAFFEVFAPTLATPPPLFTPQLPALVEMDTLPDVGPADMDDGRGEGGRGGAGAGGGRGGGSSSLTLNEDPPIRQAERQEGGGVLSSASTLTDDNRSQRSSSGGVGGTAAQETVVPALGGTGGGRRSTPPQEGVAAAAAAGHRHQSLIVSADEDAIMDSGNGMGVRDDKNAEAEAERKTLAYENAVLRQALERMGGRAPRRYVEESKVRDQERTLAGAVEVEDERRRQADAKAGEGIEDLSSSAGVLRGELDSTRAELEGARARLREVGEALSAARSQRAADGGGPPDDKISHSSFSVGDVGLFMPTGRGAPGGKRTYLAFHSDCPHRYLSTDNIDGAPDYVLGRIVYQEEMTASGRAGTDSNPYGLHAGTAFWVLTVEVLKIP